MSTPTESTEPTEPQPQPIAWEPRTWYAVTSVCQTPDCRQNGIEVDIPMLYSNNGLPEYIRVGCDADGCCGNACAILTAVKLDPQPIEE